MAGSSSLFVHRLWLAISAVLLLIAASSPSTLVAAVRTQTTAKRVPGLSSLFAFKHAEAKALGIDDPSLPPFINDIDDDEVDGQVKVAAKGEKTPYGPHTFTQPLDHFHSTTKATFKQRYWISTKYYNESSKSPTPIYVVDGGETSGVNRIPFLEHGILDLLAEATGGISIVLEHRYYGTSKPRLRDIGNKTYWDVDALRWLTNEQALEDSAHFMRNIKLPGIASASAQNKLTADKTPWIYIGGSYAGARAAHMRVLYPDIVFGAISTSGVSAAIDSFPQYYYPIARGADPACTQAIQAAIGAFDAIAVPAFYGSTKESTVQQKKKEDALRTLFHAKDLDWDDLANLLSSQLGYYQALNWDPAVSSPGWDQFCDVMTNKTAIKSPALTPRPLSSSSKRDLTRLSKLAAVQEAFARSSVASLRAELDGKFSTNGHGGDKDDEEDWLPDELFRLASYVRANMIEPCQRSGSTLRQCFSTKGTEAWKDFVHARTLGSSKAWMYQVCTQWGYFQGAAPKQPSIANAPNTNRRIHPHFEPSAQQQRPMMLANADTEQLTASSLFDDRSRSTAYTPGPQLVSSLLTLSYTASYCPEAFPPTSISPGVPDRPDIDEVNRLGSFDIGLRSLAAQRGATRGTGKEGVDRLAIINGQFDPWRPATPHSEEYAGGGARTDTLMRPFKLIPNCWHHCDQNSLPSDERKAGKEPERIRKIHEEEVAFVRAWLLRWGK
ncbi:unnamed protein product [Tilletia laevis]|uniref:Uncharacterized protein n=3 Tax=Tilletia TaxID=13289 RepID=A0A8X7N0P3_9BASI|nr:hypothetical protein CF336_g231 [Tilletia laevis]KAE8205844.1 hypothetical protein CF328_g254 [Tilletia controversa]KAE8263019.1 hypothetical protein A4X03_0g1999 [Tilletia caries]KAE8208925.1 hypothetical protein CF335_g66 [Tilletia laevis]KAE8255974.1 hypothetical protein A4X06_0g161 [Tilletia controversa]